MQLIPVNGVKPELDKNELEALSNEYRLGNIADQEGYQKFGAKQSYNILLTTTQGHKYVVKRFECDPREFTDSIVGFQVDVNDFLERFGVPIPKIFSNRNGSKLTSVEDAIFTLMEHVDGKNPNRENQDEVDLMFQGLAQLNSALSHFKSRNNYAALDRFTRPLKEQFEELKSYLPTTLNSVHSEMDKYVLDHISEVEELIDRVEERVKKTDLKRQLIHGNPNLTASIIKNGKLEGIVDLDFLREEFSGADFMHAADIYCIDKLTKEMPSDQRVNWDKLKHFFNEYKKFDPNVVNEIELMPLSLAHQVGVGSIIVTWGWGYKPDTKPQLRSYVQRGRYHMFLTRTKTALELEDKIIETLQNA